MAGTPVCPAAIHLCAIRVTRLDQLGNPLAGPNNYYVSGNSIQVVVTPEIETGTEKILTGGCDCVIAAYKGTDKLKRFTLELDQGIIEPGLQEMMTGAAAIIDATTSSANATPIGVWWPTQLDCSATQQPNVAFEAWSDLWQDDHPVATPYKYLRYIWPSTHWQIGSTTLQNDFTQPKLTGFTRSNPLWGVGPYHDLPQAAQPMGGWFYDNNRPAASCGYQTTPIT